MVIKDKTIKYVFEHCIELFNQDESKAYKEKIHELFYSRYPEKPFINSKLTPRFNGENLDMLLNCLGYDFKVSTTKRILSEHKNHPLLNYCPKCGELTRTPQAKQCRFCSYNWH